MLKKLLNEYRNSINPNVWLHSLDLSGYGTSQFIGNKINLISGWSDKMLEFIKMSEGSDGTLIQTINNYEL